MQIASVAFYLRLPARGKDRLPSGRPDFMPVLYVFGNSVDYTKQSEVLYSGNFPIYPEVFFFLSRKRVAVITNSARHFGDLGKRIYFRLIMRT